MNKEGSKRTAARVLIALLAVALVFTMMPLSMGKAFAAENTGVSGLTVNGDVENELTFKDMKTMKNDPAVKAVSLPKAGSDGIASDGVAFHAKNKKGTETDVTVKGITLDDLIAIAGLKDGAELISATPTSSDGYAPEYTAEMIQTPDLKGNKAMFVWGLNEAGTDYKVQTVVRGQFTEGEMNNSDWVSDVTTITVKALDKPVIKVTSKKKKAIVKWAADEDAEQYVVMRATKKAGKYKKVGTVKAGKASFTDKKVKKGKKFFYQVTAVAGDLENVSAAKKVKIK